jgi:hypothetical protein
LDVLTLTLTGTRADQPSLLRGGVRWVTIGRFHLGGSGVGLGLG